MPRIALLKEKEVKEFDTPTILANEQRVQLFDKSGIENMDRSFRKPVSRIGFVLQRGYFLLQKKFFSPKEFHLEDIAFVSKMFGSDTVDMSMYKRQMVQDHRHMILDQLGFTPFSKGKEIFEKEVGQLVKTPLRPRALFFALNEFLSQKKIEFPRYYVFAKSIGRALNSFEKNLIYQVDAILDGSKRELLDSLMALPINEKSGRNPYLITKLKKPLQGLTPKKIKASIKDFEIIAELHQALVDVVEGSGISQGLVNYYAVWVIKAKYVQFESIGSIKKKRLYLIAFIIYQYRIRQDLFVDTFLQCVQKYLNDIDKRVMEGLIKHNEKLPTGNKGKFSKVKSIILCSKQQMEQVRNILFDHRYGDSEKLYRLKELIGYGKNEFHDQLLSEIKVFENTGNVKFREQIRFEELDKGYRKIQNRVGGILQVLDFNTSTSNPDILTAVQYYQRSRGKITPKAPDGFIAESDRKRMFLENGDFATGLYKVLLFKEVANNIKAGLLNLRRSDKYISMDQYLIPMEKWAADKKKLLERAGITYMGNVGSFLSACKEDLHNQYVRINERAHDNLHLHIGRNGKAIVKTPRIENKGSDGIIGLLGEDLFKPLVSILSDVRYPTDFVGAFLHYSRKGSTKVPSDDILFAAIIAMGCNIGVRKMGKISKGIGPDRLEYAVRWHFSKENIDDANQRIVSFTNELSLPTIFKKNKSPGHTSSDGQKFDVTVPSLHATRSYKYFGFGKGVSAYSFIDQKSRLFYSTVISASEREAGYVLDGLMHNEGIEGNIHSTDTHGYSEIVFGLSNALGIFFAPRIKNYKDQLLYTFKEKPRKLYEKSGYRVPSKNGTKF